MTIPILPPLKPLPIKDRISVVYIEKGNLDVIDGSFVVVDKNGVRTHIPIGSVACLMLEPGTRVSHSAVVLAARVVCLLVWIGEAGVMFPACAGMTVATFWAKSDGRGKQRPYKCSMRGNL